MVTAIDEALGAESARLHREMFQRHAGIIADVIHERVRQEARWGVQEHTSDRWNAILGEERGEIEHAINEAQAYIDKAERVPQPIVDNLYEELVQTVAVGLAWLEDWKRRGLWG